VTANGSKALSTQIKSVGNVTVMDVDFFSGENVFTLTTSHDSREVRHAHTHALKKNFFFFGLARAHDAPTAVGGDGRSEWVLMKMRATTPM